ncbi:MAG: ABC transporter ATP-binding protein [Candidatus Krumholzibacteriota bacterium]
MIIQVPVKNRTLDRDSRGTILVDRPSRVQTQVPDSSPEKAGSPAVVLEVRDLQKSFRSGFLKRRIRGVEGVSFSVNQSSVFALIGHNGAGKTTTINCILDLVHADGGEVSIMGMDHRDPSSRSRVGYLPERPYFFEHLTGRELLKFYARLLDLPKDRRVARIDEVLDMVGMTEFAGRRLKKFSKGMLQRIGLAQAILGDPDILILDEPMSGLDPIGRREIRQLLMDLKNAGKTIILSSHIVPDVEMIADTVGVLKEGCLVAVRDLTELTQGFSYTGDLHLGATDPTWLPAGCRSLGEGKVRVQIDSVGDLRKLLNDCHREAIPVESLETHRSCLEELFMEINREIPVKREVGR